MSLQKRSWSLLPYLLILLLISLPWQLRFIIPSTFTYYFGLFHEYTSFFIYLTDLIFALTLLVWGGELSSGKRKFKLPPPLISLALIAILASSLAPIFHTTSQALVIYKTIKLTEFILFFFLISNRILPLSKMIFWFAIGVIGQAVLAVIQFFQQSSVGLKYLGEIFLQPQLPGIAKFETAQGLVMRAYGTLPHPNVLAGFLVIALLFSLIFLLKPGKYFVSLTLAVFLPALLVSFSRHAWLGLALALFILVILLRKKLGNLIKQQELLLLVPPLLTLILMLSLIFPVLNQRLDLVQFRQEEAVQGRWNGIADSFQLLRQENNWLIGVGPGNFTLRSAVIAEKDLYPWERQPVHNFFLLIWSEQGILGLVSFLLLLGAILAGIWQKKLKQPLELQILLSTTVIALFILSLFDHYLVDIQQGALLFWLTLGLIVASWHKNMVAELSQPVLPTIPSLAELFPAKSKAKKQAASEAIAKGTQQKHGDKPQANKNKQKKKKQRKR